MLDQPYKSCPPRETCQAEGCLAKRTASSDLCVNHLWTERYPCPRCGVAAGEYCIDVRVHRARKMLDPIFRRSQRLRSERQRHPHGRRRHVAV